MQSRKHIWIVALAFLIALCGCDTGLSDHRVMYLLDGKTVLKGSGIPTGKPVLMVNLIPGSKVSKAHVETVLDHLRLLRDVRVYFISTGSIEQTQQFVRQHSLTSYPNVTVCLEKTLHPGAYNPYQMPGAALYDSEKEVIEVFRGRNSMDQLKEILDTL